MRYFIPHFKNTTQNLRSLARVDYLQFSAGRHFSKCKPPNEFESHSTISNDNNISETTESSSPSARDPPEEGCISTKLLNDSFSPPEGLDSKVFRPLQADEILGPGAHQCGEYKNPEFYSFHKYSFLDINRELIKFRVGADTFTESGESKIPEENAIHNSPEKNQPQKADEWGCKNKSSNADGITKKAILKIVVNSLQRKQSSKNKKNTRNMEKGGQLRAKNIKTNFQNEGNTVFDVPRKEYEERNFKEFSKEQGDMKSSNPNINVEKNTQLVIRSSNDTADLYKNSNYYQTNERDDSVKNYEGRWNYTRSSLRNFNNKTKVEPGFSSIKIFNNSNTVFEKYTEIVTKQNKRNRPSEEGVSKQKVELAKNASKRKQTVTTVSGIIQENITAKKVKKNNPKK